MLTWNYDYKYEPENLTAFNIDLFSWNFDTNLVIIMWTCLFIWIMVYIIMPYIIWYYLMRSEKKKKTDNRNKIRELILMKEVQWELEKEIEESMLNESVRVPSMA